MKIYLNKTWPKVILLVSISCQICVFEVISNVLINLIWKLMQLITK